MYEELGPISMEMDKTYDPHAVEEKWYRFWEEKGFFHSEVDTNRTPFTIVIPPPNVTGVLHMGHGLNNTIQDTIIRWKRMQGFNALWLPGTDHAGIATQNVVEKELAKSGKSRHEVGRDNFIELVWEWREKYGFTIFDTVFHVNERNNTIVIVIKTENKPLSKKIVHAGPPVKLKKHTLKFVNKWIDNPKVIKKPYIKDGRIYVEIEREYRNIKEYLQKKILSLSMGKDLEKTIIKRYDIVGIEKLVNNDLRIFWTRYLDKKMPWER